MIQRSERSTMILCTEKMLNHDIVKMPTTYHRYVRCSVCYRVSYLIMFGISNFDFVG